MQVYLCNEVFLHCCICTFTHYLHLLESNSAEPFPGLIPRFDPRSVSFVCFPPMVWLLFVKSASSQTHQQQPGHIFPASPHAYTHTHTHTHTDTLNHTHTHTQILVSLPPCIIPCPQCKHKQAPGEAGVLPLG